MAPSRLSLSARALGTCNSEYDSNCESMSYATRAGIGFVIFIVLFALFAALSVRRRRRALHAFQAQQRLSSAGVAVHPTAGGAWSQHLAGGPAAPPQAHYAGVYAPGYMAPPTGPPPAPEEQYPPPPQYELPKYAPPPGAPPGQGKTDAV